MNFQTAIRSGFQNYTNFKGRALRSEFLWWQVLLIVCLILALFYSFFGFALLALILPSISVGVRRLHDLDKRGWWILLGGYGGLWIVLAAWKGDAGENRFGPPPPPLTN